jgi:SIR2-like domain
MSTTPTAAIPLTVRETLALLDGSGDRLFRHFEEAGYALWLGSGISFGRLRRLSDIIRDSLSFLRAKIQPADPNCRFRKALTAALRLVLSDHELAAIDFNWPVASWPGVNELLNRLTSKYADLLDITVDGEEDDYLLWEGVRVTDAFADPATEPDAEHLCIAILGLEGLLPEIMSANWDGLIEKAAEQLSGKKNLINVCVRPEDVRQVGFLVRLYKFHGCAVLALRDENTYRPYLIARKSQIDRWREDHAVLVQSLVNIIRSRATLMIGLSAQDSNIRSAFAAASATLNWPWPGTFPAIVFSQTELGNDQLVLLKNVYRTEMTPANREQIQADSHIPTYAKQLLLALVLKILSGKLKLLLHGVEGKLSDAERDYLAEGLVTLRDIIADAAAVDHYDFIRLFIEHFSRLLGTFRNGEVPPDPRLYNALTTSPASHIAFDPGIPASGLQELAVAIATLGIGVRLGLWTLHPGASGDPTSAALEIQTPIRRYRVFFAASAESALKLFASGRLSSSDSGVVVHSKTIVEPKPRSPARFVGRTGTTKPRAVSISSLLREVATAAELTQRFRREVAL